MPDPLRVIQALPLLEYKTLSHAFYDEAPFSFSHTHAERAYPNVPRAAHEWVGLDPEQLTFTLYFLNSLAPDASPPLFPDAWNAWWAVLQDGTPGVLRHPLLGVKNVVINGGDVTLTAKTTAGVIARVTFTRTILDPAKPENEAKTWTYALDVAEKVSTLATARDVFEPDENAQILTLFDLIKQIEGAKQQAQLAALGFIERAQAIVVELVDFLGDHYDAENVPLVDSLTQLHCALQDTAKEVGQNLARGVQSITTTRATTLEAFASEHGNTLGEVIGLNPEALAAPMVPAKTVLRFYVA